MTIEKFGDWSKVGEILRTAPQRLKDATRKALLQEGQFLRNKIVEGIREQAPGGEAFAPLAPLTVAKRQREGFPGTKALVRQGDLRNSVAVKEQGEAVFVGVHRSAVGKDGKSLANVAEIHEYGAGPYVVMLTDKVRRALFALIREAGVERAEPKTGGGTGFIVIRIPPRPFVGPIWQQWGTPPEQVAERFMARLGQQLGGDFGSTGKAPPPA
jgi:hypothetical protein